MKQIDIISWWPPAFALLALFLGTAPSRADAQWLESKGQHYTVFYQAGFEQDAGFTRQWLDATEQLMKAKYGSAPDRYYVSIYLLPAPGGGIDAVQSGQNQCLDCPGFSGAAFVCESPRIGPG